jgi:hypothetical protein
MRIVVATIVAALIASVAGLVHTSALAQSTVPRCSFGTEVVVPGAFVRLPRRRAYEVCDRHYRRRAGAAMGRSFTTCRPTAA